MVANPGAARDGWESPHTSVDVVTDDAPFLVDSVSARAGASGLRHPPAGAPHAGAAGWRHHLAPAPRDRPRDRPAGTGRTGPRGALGGRRRVRGGRGLGRDARPGSPSSPRGLAEQPPPHADAADVAEVATFLAWLADDHFTFVAAADVAVDGDVVPGSELGVARRRALFREHEPARSRRRLAALAHQVVAALHRAPRRPARRGQHPAFRRRRRRGGGDALPGPLHRERLQPVGRDHPAAAPQGRAGDGAVGARAREPRRPGARPRARDVPARRAVPARRRRAGRARPRHRGAWASGAGCGSS